MDEVVAEHNTKTILAGAATATLLLVGGQAMAKTRLKRYDTRYYILYTDVSARAARQAAVRMNCMFREYYDRTRGWTTGQITQKLPFYLFRHAADYYAAGGLPGSAGVFMGRRLMAIAGRHTTPWTWHVIQHEGFHQFVYWKMQAHLPTWVNEGLAEYFGEAVFTGDGFVTGIIPPERLRRIKIEMRRRMFMSIHHIRRLSHGEWNSQLSGVNYDQAWSMVYFLAHADHHRFRRALGTYLRLLVEHVNRIHAWNVTFGNDDKDFQMRWRKYWLGLPPDPSRLKENQATCATLTSFLARWRLLRKRFANAQAFFRYAAAHHIPAINDRLWLPQEMLKTALQQARTEGQWTLLHPKRRRPRLELTDRGHDVWIGRFSLSGGAVRKVQVAFKKNPNAQAIRDGGY